MADQTEQVYEYQPERNRKAKARTILILGAGGVLGAGVLAASAIGVGGAVEEIDILQNHSQQEEAEPAPGHRGSQEQQIQPESSADDSQQPDQMPGEPLAPLDSQGFAPGEGEGHPAPPPGSIGKIGGHGDDHEEGDHERGHGEFQGGDDHQENHSDEGFESEDD